MRLTDFNHKITAKSLNEGLEKKYGQRIAVEKYTLEQLQDARNNLRTQLRDIETNESFNAVDGPVYQKTKSFLDVLNAEIQEREHIQEAGKPDFLDLDKDGDKKEPMKKAAKDAGKGSKGGKPKKGKVPPQFKKNVKENVDKDFIEQIQKVLDSVGLTKDKQEELLQTMEPGMDKVKDVHKKGMDKIKSVRDKGMGNIDNVMKKGMDSMKGIQGKFKASTDDMMKKAGFESVERTDEWVPLAIGIAGAGWAAYEIGNAVQEYQEDGDKTKLARVVGSEAAYAIAGGMIAKGVALAGKAFLKGSAISGAGGGVATGAVAMDPDMDGVFDSIEESVVKEDARELMAYLKDQGITDVDPKLQLAIRDYFYDKKKTAPQKPAGGDGGEQDWDWKGALEAEAEILMKAGYSREQAYKQAYKDIKHRRTFEPGGSHHNAMKRHDKAIKDLRARSARGEIPKVSSDEMDKILARKDAMFKRMGGDELESMAEQVQNSIVNALMEGEEEKAALVMASKDMVDKVTSWMEDTAEMQTESMLELGDKIRDEIDSATSEQFINTVKPALEALFTALEAARGSLSSGVATVTGEGDDMMGADPTDTGMDLDMDMDDDDMEPTVDDEFASADASAGGEEDAGRAKRESIERSRKLGTILSKKK